VFCSFFPFFLLWIPSVRAGLKGRNSQRGEEEKNKNILTGRKKENMLDTHRPSERP
jgi:hypothetical protein